MVLGYTKYNVFFFRYTWPCVYPSLYGDAPPVSTRIISVSRGPNFLRSTYPQPGCQLSSSTGSCPLEKIPADYWLIHFLFTDPNGSLLPITAPFGGRFPVIFHIFSYPLWLNSIHILYVLNSTTWM